MHISKSTKSNLHTGLKLGFKSRISSSSYCNAGGTFSHSWAGLLIAPPPCHFGSCLSRLLSMMSHKAECRQFTGSPLCSLNRLRFFLENVIPLPSHPPGAGHTNTMRSPRGLRLSWGTVASLDGKPTGSSIRSFSFRGLWSSWRS